MNVLEAISTRRSIRVYQDKPVEEEKILRILEAGRLSPSARNEQKWKFLVVREEETRRKLMEAAQGQKYVAQAPVVLVACATDAKRVMRCGQVATTIDVSIALTSMILTAWELGLGTCWLGNFDAQEVKMVLEIPEQVQVIAITPLGYPDENPGPRPRRNLEEVICWEKYS